MNSCVLTKRAGTLCNDFFTNILDIDVEWKQTCENKDIYNGVDRNTLELLWTATRCDLIFGSNSNLRAYSEVYASDDAELKFINDFIRVWNKVMNSDIIYDSRGI